MKKKLTLEALKVKSFTTIVKANLLQGGLREASISVCDCTEGVGSCQEDGC